MTTTIQISNETKQLLEILKKQENVNTYDKIIYELAKEHTKISKSMFGNIKGLRWNKKDRLKLNEL